MIKKSEAIIITSTNQKSKIKNQKFILLRGFILLLLLLASVESQAQAGKKDRFRKTIEVGYEQKSGNTDKTDALIAGSLLYREGQSELLTTVYFNHETSGDEETANRGGGGINYDYDLTPKHTWFVFEHLRYDRFRKIDTRTESALGWKYTFFRREEEKLSFSLAGIYEYTDFSRPVEDRSETRVSTRIKYNRKIFSHSRFSHVTFYKPNVKNSNDYLITSETVLRVHMNSALAINISAIDEYDNTPAPGVERNDFSLRTSMTITF